MAVGCFLVSIVVFLLVGFYWLMAQRVLRQSRRSVRKLKSLIRLSRGKRNAMSRMRVRKKEVGQRRGIDNRFRPATTYAKAKGFGQKIKKGLSKIYGGKA